MPSREGTELVRAFRRVRALVVGDALLDSYIEGTADRLCSEGPVPVVRQTKEQHSAGGAGNTAANLSALGAGVAFVGLIGDDAAGAALRAALSRSGVDDRWLVRDASVRTIHKMRILANGQYVVRLDEGHLEPSSAEAREALLTSLEAAFEHCDVVVVSDYLAGTVTEDVVAKIAELRRRRRIPLVVDSKQLVKFRQAEPTVVTPNHVEAETLVRSGSQRVAPPAVRALNLRDVQRIAGEVLGILGAENVAITLNEHGVLLLDRAGDMHHLPTETVVDPNVVGAGDTFTAALALALTVGGSIVEAAQVALATSSLVVAKRHTAVVTQAELLKRLRGARDTSRRRQVITAELGDPRALQALQAKLDADRREGRTIVFTNGVFDIVHAGHVQFLRRARELGDVLVIGVNSDRSVRRLKGTSRPINSESDRLALMAALDPVDHVVLFDEDTPAELIRALRPQVHVKGGDYANRRLPEADAVEEVGARTVILPRIGHLSTSNVIDRILTGSAREVT